MELAIINGTYRDSSTKTAAAGNISHDDINHKICSAIRFVYQSKPRYPKSKGGISTKSIFFYIPTHFRFGCLSSRENVELDVYFWINFQFENYLLLFLSRCVYFTFAFYI